MVSAFIGVRPNGRRILRGSLGRALVVVWFIRSRWIHFGVPLGSLGSSGVAGLIGARPGDRRVRPGSLGSLGHTLGVVGFVRGRWVLWGALRGFVRGRKVHYVTPWRSTGSSSVDDFIAVRPSGRRVLQGSLGSLVSALGVVGFTGVAGCIEVGLGFIRCRCVHWGAPWGSSISYGIAGLIGVHPDGRRVLPGSQGSFGCSLKVVTVRCVH